MNPKFYNSFTETNRPRFRIALSSVNERWNIVALIRLVQSLQVFVKRNANPDQLIALACVFSNPTVCGLK